MLKVVKFRDIKNNEAFTPAPGQVGATKTYIKKVNGICPQVGVSELLEDGSFSEVGIFWPDDKVTRSNPPLGFIKKYL